MWRQSYEVEHDVFTDRWLQDQSNDTMYDFNNTSNITDTLLDDDDGDGERSLGNRISVVLSNMFLFFLIFGLSATVKVGNLKHQLTNKFAIFTGVAMQFMIMPILGFVAVMAFRDSGYTKPMGVLLLVVTASPGGSYSNWWCSLFNAELALSVAMTSVSSILSIGLLPLNLLVYSWLAYTVLNPDDGDNVNILESLDLKSIFISLGIVMGAIVLGLVAGYYWDNETFHKRANAFGSVCGLLLILFSVFLSSGADGADTNFWSLDWAFYVGTAFPCVLGMTLANVLSRTFRLSHPECVAISIECCYQNTAIATSVAVTMYTDPNERAEAISVPLFYGVVEAIIIGLYCVWAWKVGWTKAPADENVCVVMTKTYETEDHHNVEESALQAAEMGNSSDGKKTAVSTTKVVTIATSAADEDEEDKLTAPTATSTITTMTGATSTRTTGDRNIAPKDPGAESAGRTKDEAAVTTPKATTALHADDRDRFYSADTSAATVATAPITPMTPGNRSTGGFPTPTPPKRVVRLRLDLDGAEGRQQADSQRQEDLEAQPSSTPSMKKQPAKVIISDLGPPKPPSGKLLLDNDIVKEKAPIQRVDEEDDAGENHAVEMTIEDGEILVEEEDIIEEEVIEEEVLEEEVIEEEEESVEEVYVEDVETPLPPLNTTTPVDDHPWDEEHPWDEPA